MGTVEFMMNSDILVLKSTYLQIQHLTTSYLKLQILTRCSKHFGATLLDVGHRSYF